jgi:hypothetical protein
VTTTTVWLRCDLDGRNCSLIPGATASSYTLTTADTGHTLIVEVSASAEGASQSSFSAATAAIS